MDQLHFRQHWDTPVSNYGSAPASQYLRHC
jgi:hypothetical protein